VDVVVPVGSSAHVVLPGLEADVEHGRHSWTVAWTPGPAAAPRTVRELMDDETAWRRFCDVVLGADLRAMAPLTDDVAVAERLAPLLDEPLVAAVDALAMEGAGAGRDRLLDELSDLLPADRTRD
jgi:hypothetical protein